MNTDINEARETVCIFHDICCRYVFTVARLIEDEDGDGHGMTEQEIAP